MGLFGKIGKAFKGATKGIAKAASAVASSKVLKVAGGAVSIAFPPAAPVVGSVMVAGRIVEAAQGKTGSKPQQAAAKRAIVATIKQAKTDPNAARAVSAMLTAAKIKRAAAASGKPIQIPGSPGWFVNDQGMIKRVG